jgi:hypothetical protein
MRAVVEGRIEGGLEEYERLRRMYGGSGGATCDIVAGVVAEGLEVLVPVEVLYFYKGGLGKYAEPKAWMFPEIDDGRYHAIVYVNGKERERVDLKWVPLGK